ncbi:hypothetical protein P3X46_007187 [Hevea brasiliensis]|uniref:F-box domain-containing protein n=1 Tax=Hevea brasiliensis TaxID=3981 RepID=A0ABQ9MSP9_HEVBR|nr:hypothetical protein P3X46_007187 [Hevea brasiliensis]
MEESIQEVDYISELPEPVLYHILSFLSIKQAARTSVLSKTWFQVWRTIPILKFDFFELFNRRYGALYYYPDFEIRQTNIQELYNFLEQILLSRQRQMINLIKFTLIMPSEYPEIVPTMDRWIGYALESKVKHLKISVFPPTSVYCVPQALLNAISVQVLDLQYLHLPSIGNVTLPFLKKLSLTCVFANDNLVSKLVAGSPLIEDMSFITCFGFKTVKIFNLVNLVKFYVESIVHLEQLEVEAPNLHSLTLRGSSWPSVLKLVSLKYLKSLTIHGAPITDKWLHEQLNKFPHLECLRLVECHILESIKISSSSLHTLCIKSCKKAARLQIDTPNLHIFSYRGDIILFSSNDLILPQVYLYFKFNNMETFWYIRLIQLLEKFNQCFRKVTLKSETGEVCPDDNFFYSNLCSHNCLHIVHNKYLRD